MLESQVIDRVLERMDYCPALAHVIIKEKNNVVAMFLLKTTEAHDFRANNDVYNHLLYNKHCNIPF